MALRLMTCRPLVAVGIACGTLMIHGQVGSAQVSKTLADTTQRELDTPDLFAGRDGDVADTTPHPIDTPDATRDQLIQHWRSRNHDVLQKLLEPAEIAFFESPLDEVVDQLSRSSGFEILIDNRALESLGLDSSLTVTKKLSNVPLRAALDAILGEHELTYFARDGILFITSQEEAEQKLVTRVYNVQSLLPPDQPWQSLDDLVKVITTSVQPDSWQEVGGPGTVVPYQMTLVVSQTGRNHESIEHLLRELDEVVAAAGGPKLRMVRGSDRQHLGRRRAASSAGRRSD